MTETMKTTKQGGTEDTYALGAHHFRSRLIIGSGKYESFEQNLACAEASGAEMVTVALRRVDFDAPKGQGLLDIVSPKRFTILPNTAGCYNVEDALTTARLGRELLDTDLVKLEVIGDERTLFPDVAATLQAAAILIEEGFTVLPYVTDDPVACQRLAAMGCAAVMPLAAPIGSGMGIRNPANLRIILETVGGTGHRRCRCWNCKRRRDGDGTRCHRNPAQHRNCQSQGTDRHGEGDATGRRSRKVGVRRRPHAKATLCLSFESNGRPGVILNRSRRPARQWAHS